MQTPSSEKFVVIPSIFKNRDGSSRFEMPIPIHLAKNDNGLRAIAEREVSQGGYQIALRAFIDDHIDENDLFIDVGAHWGIFTLTVASKIPNKIRVLAIEANPLNIHPLYLSLLHNKLTDNVKIINTAAAEKYSILPLYHHMGTMGAYNDIDNYKAIYEKESIRQSLHKPENVKPMCHVTAASLDEIVSTEDLSHINNIFIKIDVEGTELDVIKGTKKLLSTNKVAALIMEKGHIYFEDKHANALKKVIKDLESQSYKTFMVDGEQLIPYEERPEPTDLIFVHPNLKINF